MPVVVGVIAIGAVVNLLVPPPPVQAPTDCDDFYDDEYFWQRLGAGLAVGAAPGLAPGLGRSITQQLPQFLDDVARGAGSIGDDIGRALAGSGDDLVPALPGGGRLPTGAVDDLNPAAPLRSQGNPGPNRPADSKLVKGLAEQGIKHTPEDIVRIRQTPTGKTVFLEKGNSRASLEHIVKKHGEDFARKGISEEQIPDVVITAVTEGKLVGTQGSRPIYETVINGVKQRIAVTVGNNGFIVGANPAQ